VSSHFFLLRQLHGGVPGGVIHGPWLAEGLTSLQQEKATTCLHPHLTEAREVRCRVGSKIAYEYYYAVIHLNSIPHQVAEEPTVVLCSRQRGH